MTNFNYSRRAFTLIEFIIVIAIIVIMLAVSIPITANAIVERSLYNTAVQVQQDVRLVQQLAISHSTDSSSGRFEIYFYPSDNKYYVEAAEDAVFNSPTDMTGRVITRQFSSAYGFPKYFEKDTPLSIKLYDKDGNVKSVPSENYIVISFNNLGEPTLYCHSNDNDSGIMLSNATLGKEIQIKVTSIGRVNIEWIQR